MYFKVGAAKTDFAALWFDKKLMMSMMENRELRSKKEQLSIYHEFYYFSVSGSSYHIFSYTYSLNVLSYLSIISSSSL